ELLVQLGQNLVAEAVAARLQGGDAPAQLRVAAGAVAVPDHVVVRGRRDAEAGHDGQCRLGETPGLLDRIGIDHMKGLTSRISDEWLYGRRVNDPSTFGDGNCPRPARTIRHGPATAGRAGRNRACP